MSVQNLANMIAAAVKKANDKTGMAEKGIITGDRVVCEGGAFSYDAACPVNLYDGKQVWVQRTADGIAVIIGD